MKRAILLATVAAALLPFAAQAQSYDRLVTFGDSLSDNGNLFATTGNPPAPYNNRFTNQLVWSEYMVGTQSGFLNPSTAGNVNYAFGGARTDSAPNSNGPIPGMPTQVNTFIARGGTFGARDVVSIWGGANNIFQGLPVAASNPATATTYMGGVAQSSVTDMMGQATQLIGKGAKNILIFNLPDLGSTPQFSSDPSASALATYSSTALNTILKGGTQQLAAANTSVNIIQVDINGAFADVMAQPAAYGLTNVTTRCIAVAACVTGTNDVRNTYLFWDGVHPTATGHKLVANLVTQYLYTPTLASGVGMLAEGSMVSRRDSATDVTRRIGNAMGSEGDNMVYFDVVGIQRERNSDVWMQSAPSKTGGNVSEIAYDQDLTGIRFGATHMLSGNSAFGIGATILSGESKAFMVDADVKDFSVDIGFNHAMGDHFFTATAGVGQTLYGNYRRQTMVAPIVLHKNEVKASSYSLSVQGGMHMGSETLKIIPVVRLSYVGATMEGFNELGSVTAVGFEDRKVNALTGAVEVQMASQLSENTWLSGMIGYEGLLSSENGALEGQLLNNTAHPFSQELGDLTAPGVTVGVGLSHKMGDYKLKARYAGQFGDNDQKSTSAMVTVSRSF